MEDALLQLGLAPIGRIFFPPSAAYLGAIEDLIGAALPASYRSFLARFGACTFTDAVGCHLPDASWVDVHIFLGNDPDDSYDLSQSYLQLRDTWADGLLPVATCPLGNAFCLTLTPPVGCVRYVEVGGDGCFRLADGFDSFVAGLRRLP